MLYRGIVLPDPLPPPGGPYTSAFVTEAEPLAGPPSFDEIFFEIGVAVAILLGAAVLAAGLMNQWA
jgi:hypothetical protein